MATDCGANTTSSSLCSFSHLHQGPFPSLSYCRELCLVFSLLCRLEPVLRYSEKSSYTSVHRCVTENKVLPLLPSSCGLIWKALGFSASAGNSTFINKKLQQEKSVWDFKIIRKSLSLCHFSPVYCLSPGEWDALVLSYRKPSLGAFVATCCHLVVKLQMFGGGNGVTKYILPDSSGFIH